MTDQAQSARPHSRLTARVRRDVLADRAAFRFATSQVATPTPELLARVATEVGEAAALFAERGWTDDPESYHRTPRPLQGGRTSRIRSTGLPATRLTWPDRYEPRPEEPGAERYAGYGPNRIARAALIEHRGKGRPWLVCVHGWGMGSPGLDLRAFRAGHLHHRLGLNLAFVTLPFHGRRKPPGSGLLARMPGADVLDNVHGLQQSVWDVRQLIAHLRTRTDQPIGLLGLSLGGYVAALTASLDVDVHAALLLVPAVDLGALLLEGAERIQVAGRSTIPDLTEGARRVLRPVAPLALTPRVAVDRRFIMAATLDRFAKPSTQALALWRHWDEPELHWVHGGHVGVFWAKGAQDAVDGALVRFGLGRPTTPSP